MNCPPVLHLLENSKIILELDGQGNQTARNVYGINLIAGTYNNQVLYYLYNGHADVTGIVDSAGTIQAGYYYDSYGVILESTGNVNNSITYAGYTFDAETGLYYLNSRMYNPNTARFMQEDTYNGEASSPLSLNIYVYCTNNPLTYYDPNGNMGLIQALDLILFAYIDSLVAWTPEEFMANFRKDTYIPDRLTFAFEAASAYINEYKQEAAVVAFTSFMVVGGMMMMPDSPAIGSGMINAGVSIGSMGCADFKEDGKINYSVMDYTKTGIAGFASGAMSGGIAKYGISIGLKGVSNSVFASVGDMAGNAVAQYILTGKVDAKQMIVSGATSFICSEGIRNAAKIVTPKSMAATATKAAAPESPATSKTKTFFADETGELSIGKDFDERIMGGNKAKTGPKPFGVGAHNNKITDVTDSVVDGEVIAGGQRIINENRLPEAVIQTPNGVKSSRRPDILVERHSDGSIYGINVGKTLKNGIPTKREMDAIYDLEDVGIPMYFVSYN